MEAWAQRHHRHAPIREHAGRANNITGGCSLGGVHGEMAAGLRVDYERFLDRNGHFSFGLPLNFYVAGTVGVAREGSTRHHMHGLHIAPGLRFHPAGNYRAADFSIGASMLVGSCNDNVMYVDGTINLVKH